MSTATVKIIRTSAYADYLRHYKVLLDNEVICEIADSASKEFTVEPGEHSIYVKIDWARSNKINFNMGDEETITFECSSNIQGVRLLLAILYAIFRSNRYLKLKQLP